jgi:programmed cell death 6-interacting protein
MKLVEKQQRYRHLLIKAGESDELVRQKWDEWEQNIVSLTWSEVRLLWLHSFSCQVSQKDLEASVPASTFSTSSPLTPEGKKTQAHARVLRVLLESLDELDKERKKVVKRAQRLADADDISDRILQEASKFDQMADIQPLMFEEVSDQELAKYDKFLVELREFGEKQSTILADVKVRLFHMSTEIGPDVPYRKETSYSCNLGGMTPLSRTESLAFSHSNSLISSIRRLVATSKKVTRLLSHTLHILRLADTGLQFYNDLAGLLINFKEECRTWTQQRRHEMQYVDPLRRFN